MIVPKPGTAAAESEFMARYKAALAKSSGAVMAHAELLKAAFTEPRDQ
jgi:hypothetical protein